ncbi:MFS drug efflux [Seiridium cupressi]
MCLQDKEDEASGPRAVHGWKWAAAAASLYTGALIYGLDGTIAANIQSLSSNSLTMLKVSPGWAPPSLSALAALYDIFDLKALFITSVVLFEAASALCGAAPTINALIVGRAVAGVGGTGIFLGVIAALCAPVYIYYLPRVKPTGSAETHALKILRALDWTGFISSTGAVVSLSMVLTFAGSTWGWRDGRTIATIVVSSVLFSLTFLQQYFVLFTTRKARMLPPHYIFMDRTQILLKINTAMAATNIYVPVYYIPIYFAFTHGDSAMMAAGILLPMINYYWVLYLVRGILMTVGSATMYTVKPSTPMANVYGYSIILGAGTGLVFNLGFTVASVTVMTKTGSSLDIQHVLSMQNLSQLGFQRMSLLIGGQIFQSLSMRNLTQVFDGLGFSQADIRNAITGTQSTLFTSLSPSLQGQAISAVTSAMSQVYVLSIAASVITVISAMLMKKERLFPAAAGKTM